MKKTVLAFSAFTLTLSGCSSLIGVKRDIDRDTQHNDRRVEQQLAQMPVNQQKDQRLLYTSVVPQSWLGAAKIPDKAKNVLPDVFNKDVTLVFPDRANLSTIAERLTKATGIPVKLRPDVFIKTSDLTPKGSSGAGAPAGPSPASGLNLGMPSSAGIVAGTVSSDYVQDSTLNYTGPLSGLLDLLCTKAGINWEVQDGKIVLYRLVTKTFTLKSTPGSSQLSASVGKTGSTQTGTSGSGGSGGGNSGSGSFAADSSVKMASSFSVWDNLRDSINAMLTPVGKVAVTEATGTITVTDTREVVDQIDTMLKQINKSLTRQVAFRVEVLSLETAKGAEYGVDWNLVFNKLVSNNPAYKLTMGAPASLASANAGSLTYSVLTPSGSSNNMSQLNSSQAMLAAMSSLGRASVVTTASALTLNRQPVPVAITDQTGYVQSVTAQTGTSGSTSTSAQTLVQINPGIVTTGFILNLLPSVTEDDSVLLQFSVDISSLKSLTTFGQGDLAVQTPQVTGMQFLQRVGLKNGQTLVLSGFERTSGQYDRRTMSEDADLLMGGSLNGSRKREAIVILITPVISEGA